MKDYLEYQGILDITGSRDAIRAAFRANLIANGEMWMSMIKSRNLTSHSYNQDTAEEISNSIKQSYYTLFKTLEKKLEILRAGNQDKLF